MLLVFGGTALILLDQAVKYWVVRNIAAGTVRTFIPGVMSLVYVRNDGAAFSFLAGGGARVLFIALALIFVSAVIAAVRTGFIKDRVEVFCLAMVAAGGAGNCIDRIVRGYVVDMFRLELFSFPVFNVADIFITVFTFIFAVKILLTKEESSG